jgi:hypothetical protein
MFEGFNNSQIKVFFDYLAFANRDIPYQEWQGWANLMFKYSFDVLPEMYSLQLKLIFTSPIVSIETDTEYLNGQVNVKLAGTVGVPLPALVRRKEVVTAPPRDDVSMEGRYKPCYWTNISPGIDVEPHQIAVGLPPQVFNVSAESLPLIIESLHEFETYPGSLRQVCDLAFTPTRQEIPPHIKPFEWHGKPQMVSLTQVQRGFIRQYLNIQLPDRVTESQCDVISMELTTHAFDFWRGHDYEKLLHQHNLQLARERLILDTNMQANQRFVRMGLIKAICGDVIPYDNKAFTPEALLASISDPNIVLRREKMIMEMIHNMRFSACDHKKIPLAKIIRTPELRQKFVGPISDDIITCRLCGLQLGCVHVLVLHGVGESTLPKFSEIIRRQDRTLFCKVCGEVVEDEMFEPETQTIQDPEIRKMMYSRLMMCKQFVIGLKGGPLGRSLDSQMMNFIYPILIDLLGDLDHNNNLLADQKEAYHKIYTDIYMIVTFALLGHRLSGGKKGLELITDILLAIHGMTLKMLALDSSRIRIVIANAAKSISLRINKIAGTVTVDSVLIAINTIRIVQVITGKIQPFDSATVPGTKDTPISLEYIQGIIQKGMNELSEGWQVIARAWLKYGKTDSIVLPESSTELLERDQKRLNDIIMYKDNRILLSSNCFIVKPFEWRQTSFQSALDLSVTFDANGKKRGLKDCILVLRDGTEWDPNKMLPAGAVAVSVKYRKDMLRWPTNPIKEWGKAVNKGLGFNITLTDEVSQGIAKKMVRNTIHSLFVERFAGECPATGLRHTFGASLTDKCKKCAGSMVDVIESMEYFDKYEKVFTSRVLVPVVFDAPTQQVLTELPNVPPESVELYVGAASTLNCSPQALYRMGGFGRSVTYEDTLASDAPPTWSANRTLEVRARYQLLYTASRYISTYTDSSALIRRVDLIEWIQKNIDELHRVEDSLKNFANQCGKHLQTCLDVNVATLEGWQVWGQYTLNLLVDDLVKLHKISPGLAKLICDQILDADRMSAPYNNFSYIEQRAKNNLPQFDADDGEFDQKKFQSDIFYKDFIFENEEDNFTPAD